MRSEFCRKKSPWNWAVYQITVSPAAIPSRTTRIIFTRCQVLKLSRSGLRAVVPASFIAWKTGLSFSFRRTQSEMPSRITDIRNGIRQAQPDQASGLTILRVERTTITLSRKPPITPAWMKLV